MRMGERVASTKKGVYLKREKEAERRVKNAGKVRVEGLLSSIFLTITCYKNLSYL